MNEHAVFKTCELLHATHARPIAIFGEDGEPQRIFSSFPGFAPVFEAISRRAGERSVPCAVARAHRALPAAGGAPDLAPRGCARIAGGKKISPAADGARESLPAADGVFAAECGVSAAGQAFVRAPGAIRPA